VKEEKKKSIPILWKHDIQKKMGKLSPETEMIFDTILTCIIKKSRLPTLKEKIQCPSLKRIIER